MHRKLHNPLHVLSASGMAILFVTAVLAMWDFMSGQDRLIGLGFGYFLLYAMVIYPISLFAYMWLQRWRFIQRLPEQTGLTIWTIIVGVSVVVTTTYKMLKPDDEVPLALGVLLVAIVYMPQFMWWHIITDIFLPQRH